MSKYICVAYKLYADMSAGRELVEEATEKNPFMFITELGLTLDAFEAHSALTRPTAPISPNWYMNCPALPSR